MHVNQLFRIELLFLDFDAVDDRLLTVLSLLERITHLIQLFAARQVVT